MKKLFSAALAALLLFSCLFPAAAQETEALPAVPIRLRVHSDVAGFAEQDVDRLVEILSGHVVFREDGLYPVSVSNVIGESENGPMAAGREYTIVITFLAAEGYALPDALAEGDVTFECGRGARIASCRIADFAVPGAPPRSPERLRTLQICAVVVPDSNVFQRLVGILQDLWLRIRAWSLY